jgi:hypothetical protein
MNNLYFKQQLRELPEEKNEEKFFEDLIGKTFNEAIKIYNNLRIVKKDGKSKIITLEFCKERCNVEVLNDKIYKISGFY